MQGELAGLGPNACEWKWGSFGTRGQVLLGQEGDVKSHSRALIVSKPLKKSAEQPHIPLEIWNSDAQWPWEQGIFFGVGSATLLKTPPPRIGVSGAHIPAEAKHQAHRAKHELNPRGRSMWSACVCKISQSRARLKGRLGPQEMLIGRIVYCDIGKTAF